MTEAEVILWKKLSRKQLLGYKFRRQYGFDKFVADFYCPRLKLAIEIDGDLHFQSKYTEEYDQNRQILANTLGIFFLRFQNPEIYRNIDGVLRTIETTILKLQKNNKPPLKSPPF